MRRMGALACVIACLAAPAAGRADTPPGYTPIGPPATLSSIVFASNGTIYGTAFQTVVDNPTTIPAIIWRSTDHGHTWRAVYRLPTGWRVQVIQASPADPNTIYAAIGAPGRGDTGASAVRVDATTGRAVPLPLGAMLGVDAAGTAYGLVKTRTGQAIVRCKRRADACDQITAPAYLNFAVVDPNAAGVLVTSGGLNGRPGNLEISSDAGATWQQGAPYTCCGLGFGGPGPHTLYVRLDDGVSNQLLVSHDAGFTYDASPAVPPGLVVAGSHPAVSFYSATPNPIQYMRDDGVVTQVGTAPIAGSLVVDPTDPNRLFVVRGDETQLSEDGGRSWRDIADERFGFVELNGGDSTGAGNDLYEVSGPSIWYSHDRGATWARSERPIGDSAGALIVSRDDPRVAYARAATPTNTRPPSSTPTQLRTTDGGVTWQAVTTLDNRPVNWISPGEPLHVFAFDGRAEIDESVDGGVTWTVTTQDRWCLMVVVDDPASPTGTRLRCNGFWQAADPLRPLSVPVPWAPGLTWSPDLPGVFAVALPAGYVAKQSLLGPFPGADWAWSSLLEPTGAFGPPAAAADAVTAWPAAAGTTYYARDTAHGTVWVRRGTGRWWRLQVAGRDVSLLAPLDATHALVGALGAYSAHGILDLEHPSVSAPELRGSPAKLTCVAHWSAADADVAAYGWLRDGAAIPGAGDPTYTPAAGDAGHSFACRVTARTDFGSSTVTSDAYAIDGAHAAVAPAPGPARGGHALPVKVKP
jgi:photosystem II stability/assembly factor-like uncharacterized protein